MNDTTLKLDKKRHKKYFYACGKRKRAIARVYLFPDGNGDITINEKSIENYFRDKIHTDVISAPLRITDTVKKVNISVKILGGGRTAQSEAIRHGISRSLVLFNEFFRLPLKRAKFLTRDSRIKERKKYGLKRARRAPQFAKR